MFGFLKKKSKPAEEQKNDASEDKVYEGPVIVNPEPGAKEEPPAEAAPDTTEDRPGGSYFVSPHPDGGWQVKRAKAKKALKRFPTKAEAEKYAKQVASNQGTGVVRQKKDGKIQKKH